MNVYLLPVLCLLLASNAFAESVGQPPNSGQDIESQQEKDWVDSRWSHTEVGPFLASSVEIKGTRIAKGLTIKLGEPVGGSASYDTAACSLRGAWTGGFLQFDPARFGLIRMPRIQGALKFALPSGPAWPGAEVRYAGLHSHGQECVLEHTINGARVLEQPWLTNQNGLAIFSRTFEVDPMSTSIRLALASGFTGLTKTKDSQVWVAEGPAQLAIQITPGLNLELDNGTLICSFPSHTEKLACQILLCAAASDDLAKFAKVSPSASSSGLEKLLEPGPEKWLPELKTTGQRGFGTDFLTVDTLTVPYDNPWHALMFMAGVDFTPDGTAYVCTIHGDVWQIKGIDDSLRTLHWKRFATGLFQALGLKVRDGKVYVLGRDQITCLHDFNGDGEADYYENFCNSIRTSANGHDYVTSLEKDDSGNFYFVDPHGAHRVSADGKIFETISTGFRNPNGLGVSSDGKILTVAPQQGEWTPSSVICEVHPGAYFGYGGPKINAGRPLGYDAPLCWIPHSVDNSSGSQVWIPAQTWGPLGGHFLHLLWGRCGEMLVLRDVVDGVAQGAVVPLPGHFLSGPTRGSFNPKDGQLYVAGCTGWQTSAVKDGALHRVRFNNRPMHLPVGWHARKNGIELGFSEPLEKSTAEDLGSYDLHQWNYHYAASYGSQDWSVAHPEKEGHDEIPIKSAHLLADGKTVFVETAPLAAVNQVEVKYNLNFADGKSSRNQLWLTLNRLPTE